jgi:hypothetical protein
MERMDLKGCHDALRKTEVVFGAGLSQTEFQDIEVRYGFRFPPDLREFFSIGLPISNGWLNWRDDSTNHIERVLNWPYDGICFDIENNAFWIESWGKMPHALDDRFKIAKRAVTAAPKLIPIRGHRYIPDRPNEPDNPVLSVHQTDTIYYGCNLIDFFQNEFGKLFERKQHRLDGSIKRIEFWSDIIEGIGQRR